MKTNEKVISLPKGHFCANHCRDCRHLEMDNDAWNDGTRRCDWKGEWVRPSAEACPRFEL